MSGTRLSVENATRGTAIAPKTRLADGFWSRLRGLLFRPQLTEGEGLLIRPCQGVHTFGMRYPIDVVLLADGGTATQLYEHLKPWRMTGFHPDASAALELPAGRIAETETEKGDQFIWDSKNRGGRAE